MRMEKSTVSKQVPAPMPAPNLLHASSLCTILNHTHVIHAGVADCMLAVMLMPVSVFAGLHAHPPSACCLCKPITAVHAHETMISTEAFSY